MKRWIQKKLMQIVHDDEKKTHATEFLARQEAMKLPFRGLVIGQHIPQ